MSETVKTKIKNIISQYSEGVDFDVSVPPDSKLGDYSTNVGFLLAKNNGSKPFDVANDLKAKIKDDLRDIAEISVAQNGFINFHFKTEFLQSQLREINRNENYGQSDIGKKQKIIIEYSSPNIAKPMHIGHLRSTIIGDALANIYETLGYDIVRWNYIGDWGTQFGKLIAAWKRWGDSEKLKTNPIITLIELYVTFHRNLEKDPSLEGEGQKEFLKLEQGDPENLELWQLFRVQSLEEFKRMYKDLNIYFDFNKDVVKGESDYEPRLKNLIDELIKTNLAEESEGALIIDLSKYNLPVALLRKSDGATLYFTRDIATLEDRIQNYKASKILYVVANQQTLHFEQLFAVAKELEWNDTELIHVKFGMVLGEDGKKLATREGKVVALEEVMDKIKQFAYETVKNKNPDLSEEKSREISGVVGIGALKYNDLKQHPYSDITFDWQAMLDLSGNSGPYIQYTYARLMSIISKAGEASGQDLSRLMEPQELDLIKHLLNFSEAIIQSAQLYTLNGLALYLYDLAHLTNQFYEKIRVLEDEDLPRRSARLILISTVARTLKKGLGLLGIEAIDKI